MSIFSGLFKSRDKPVNRTPGSSYAFYLGGTSSGKIVNGVKDTHIVDGTVKPPVKKPVETKSEEEAPISDEDFNEILNILNHGKSQNNGSQK